MIVAIIITTSKHTNLQKYKIKSKENRIEDIQKKESSSQRKRQKQKEKLDGKQRKVEEKLEHRKRKTEKSSI